MNVQHKQTKPYAILAMALALGLLFIPMPQNQHATGVLKPLAEYQLINGSVGSYMTTFIDHWTGQQLKGETISTERGGLLSYRAKPDLAQRSDIAVGDTLGWIHSSEITAEIARLEGNLAILKASLNLERAGSRESVVQAARLRLALARTRYEERKKILSRSADLLSRNIISQQEYDDDESQERLDSIRISIAEADLASALAGAQIAKIEVIKTQIADEARKLELQLELAASLTLTSPLAGQIDFPMDRDILWTIQKTDTLLGLIPVNSRDLDFTKFTGDLTIQTPTWSTDISHESIAISPQLHALGTEQMVLLKVMLPQHEGSLQIGQRVDVVLKQRSRSVMGQITDMF